MYYWIVYWISNIIEKIYDSTAYIRLYNLKINYTLPNLLEKLIRWLFDVINMAYHGVLYSHYAASCNQLIVIWKKINRFKEIELAMYKIKRKYIYQTIIEFKFNFKDWYNKL